MDNIYYSYAKIDSYKRVLNFVVGERGVGKTYGRKKKRLEVYLATHKQTVWIRRTDKQLEKTKLNFMADICTLFPEEEFRTQGDILYHIVKDKENIIYEPVIYFIPLSCYETYKSSSYQNVTEVVFDEFMTKERYLTEEIFKFKDLLETVFRDREEVKIYLLGNSLSTCNPYFEEWGIVITDKQFVKGETFVLENCNNASFREHKRKSPIGRLMANSSYASFSIDNQFILDDTNNIEIYNNNNKFMYNLYLNSIKIGIYYCNGIVYCTDPFSNGRNYTIYVDDCTKYNAILVDKNNGKVKQIYKLLIQNRLKFKSLRYKNEIIIMCRKIGHNY